MFVLRSALRSSLVKNGSTRRDSPARKTVSFSSMPQEKKVSNVNDCLHYMQCGSSLTKVRGGSRQYRRQFSLDADCSHLRWTPTNKKPHKAKIDTSNLVRADAIREIRTGRNTEVFRNAENCLQDMQEECAFSVIYGEEYECLDLLAASPEEANIWVTGLMYLAAKTTTDVLNQQSDANDNSVRLPMGTLRERWLTEAFHTADISSAGSLSERAAVRLVRQLNSRLLPARIKLKIKEIESNKAESLKGRIHLNEFLEVYKDTATRPEIYFLMVRYANKDYMDCVDLQLFLETEQGAVNVTKETCQKIINEHEPSAEGRATGTMTIDGFTNYLLSAECSLFDKCQRRVCQDMRRPLNDYFVAASNNTYLVEDQLKGPSSVDGYISVLKRGCRFIELDVWEAEGCNWAGEGEGVAAAVFHGHSSTSKLSVSSALKVIRQFAFDVSSYPLIIRLEHHLNSLEEQRRLAALIQEQLADLLVESEDWTQWDASRLPSPESLKGKILFSGRRLEESSWNEGEMVEEDESYEYLANQRQSRRKEHERRFIVCKELSDLICPFLESMQVKDLQQLKQIDENERRRRIWSLNESVCLRLAHAYPCDFSDVCRQRLTRVYPNAVRVDSSNMNPQEFWNFGVQIVALNYQTPGLMMDLQEGKFAANGCCGYVLKPSLLRKMPDETADGRLSAADKLHVTLTPQVLHLKIISCQQLPRPRGSTAKGDSADPFVVVELFGVPGDCAEERTKTVRNEKSFQFQVTVPELALVRFLVLDDEYIGDDFIGQYTLPFECLQSGYRHVMLLNNEGEPMENCTLFVHVAVTNRRGGGKAKKRGMSVKRKHQRIHTGIKMVGIKSIDELLKNTVEPLAECIQLRTGLESALLEWQEQCGLGPAATVRQGLRTLHSRLAMAACSNTESTGTSGWNGDSDSDSNSAPAIVVQMDDDKFPYIVTKGWIPDNTKKSCDVFGTYLQRCKSVVTKTEPLLHKVEETVRKISDSYEDLGNLCVSVGLRGQKATRATENFAWNLRLLKSQIDLMYKTEQEAKSAVEQMTDTARTLNLFDGDADVFQKDQDNGSSRTSADQDDAGEFSQRRSDNTSETAAKVVTI